MVARCGGHCRVPSNDLIDRDGDSGDVDDGVDSDVDDGDGVCGGGCGSKIFVHIYSLLLLMSSNKISLSVDWSYPTPIN